MTDKEILSFIEENCGPPPWGNISIELTRNIEGGPYWSVAGLTIRAAGYLTMRDALNKWIETAKYLKENIND